MSSTMAEMDGTLEGRLSIWSCKSESAAARAVDSLEMTVAFVVMPEAFVEMSVALPEIPEAFVEMPEAFVAMSVALPEMAVALVDMAP